jgi:hypothetical protein
MNCAGIRYGIATSILLLGVTCVVEAATLDRIHAGLTYHRLDGNRFVEGQGALPGVKPVDINFIKPVRWVVGVPVGGDSLWVVVLADDSVRAVALRGRRASPIANFEPRQLAGPPVLVREDRQVSVLEPTGGGSPLTHPTPIPRQQRLAYVSTRGRLSLASLWNSRRSEIRLKALPDARVLADETGRLLLLTDPTTRYAHGVLGDSEESASMTLVDATGKSKIESRIEFPAPYVFEGIAPLWVDWNRDGRREIVATLSSESTGAQLVLYAEDGARLAESPAIGTGNRWRHAIAVAPFGPGGEMELAEVLTPHLGGKVQFFQWRKNRLERVARLGGYTSHVYGSRNLDMAVAGDFDGDDKIELLLPNQQRDRLAGIRRTASNAEVAWEASLPAPLTSNIGSVLLENGRIVIAVGLADGTLRFW